MMILKKNKDLKIIKLWLFTSICLIGLMIAVGGVTRLTGSGLSITEWNLFSGIFPPLSEMDWEKYFLLYQTIPQFELINKNITIDEFKFIFYWEYFHRLLGRLIGLFFLLPLIYFSIYKKIDKKYLFNFYLIFILICLQGFVGWYMVKSGLINNTSVSHYRLSLHLVIAFIILSSLVWNLMNIKNNKYLNFFNTFKNTIIFKYFIFLLFCQIVMGAFVSGLGAGRLYQTWPLMNDTYFPSDFQFNKLFNLINFNNHSLVQFFHRNLAYLIFIIFIFIGYKIKKEKMIYLYKPYFNLLILLLVQIILGITTLISGLNLYLAGLHQISTIFLLIFTLMLYKKSIAQFNE